ncbi:uncharacterized protein MICPUCDRAFT_52668 [Micromonas pusilla CCMP1545]|jgi:16S rRNA U516 pseudouridylate synthase RsuA-like enzyme|uniref:Predicted protein n=1 Tax=Micromonas pusilla (strain CCMP1545) TaxID=564608 RepID=C1N4S9_MICPC|nr:uncharacterized protein MICPUCDRAFT_52668 [Micromonas pusilla CCMP1545]EEH52988.1 predicted protein [Micromonas pusilla CCMP1545]|eukprot:XP_003063049.1 predicted protein [Micromonas pusilla CCMP1545]
MDFFSQRDSSLLVATPHFPMRDDDDVVVALAVHKPRGYVSERFPDGVVADASGRRSVYELIPRDEGEAGADVDDVGSSEAPNQTSHKPLTAIGRLDAETSGVLLFARGGELHRAVRGQGVKKVYVATVAAPSQESALTRALSSLTEPLSLRPRDDGDGGGDDGRGGDDDGGGDGRIVDDDVRKKKRWSSPATARVVRTWRLDDDDSDDDDDGGGGAADGARYETRRARETWRARRREELDVTPEIERRRDGKDGFVDIEITVTDGAFHLVRRLVKRAGLKMRHLRRTAVGGVSTRGIDDPGDARALTRDEVDDLIAQYDARAPPKNRTDRL